MKSKCQVCGATFGGIPLNTVKDAKKVEVCPSCYKIYNEEYKKNSCLACVFFNSGSCELFGTELEEPYVHNATCGFFNTNPDPAAIAKARIKKFEMAGRYDDAAKEYEKIGLAKEAEKARLKAKDNPVEELSLEELIAQMSQRGQTLTYFCCHCGAPLHIGSKHEPQKACPHCKYDLCAIDLVKLINQHL